MDQVTNSAYPATVAAANNGAGLKASLGTTYQYSVNNTINPQTYCITATNVTTSYFISSTNNIPTTGGCPGHGVGGVAPITNLASDPRATGYLTVSGTSGTGFRTSRYNAQGTYTTLTGMGGGPSGISSADRLTITTAQDGHGFTIDGNTEASNPNGDSSYANVIVSPGQTYTISCYLRYSGSARPFTITARAATNGTTWASSDLESTSTTSVPNGWVRVSSTVTIPSGGNYLVFMIRSSSASYDAVGDTYDVTGLMVTQGSTVYNYADGNSPNWIWNGTSNAATSTGPVL